MNPDPELQLDALFRAARGDVPETARAQFGFEARLMARLRDERSAGIFAWAWRLAPFFAVLAVAAGWWGRLSMAQVETTASAVAEVAWQGDDYALVSLVTGGRR